MEGAPNKDPVIAGTQHTDTNAWAGLTDQLRWTPAEKYPLDACTLLYTDVLLRALQRHGKERKALQASLAQQHGNDIDTKPVSGTPARVLQPLLRHWYHWAHIGAALLLQALLPAAIMISWSPASFGDLFAPPDAGLTQPLLPSTRAGDTNSWVRVCQGIIVVYLILLAMPHRLSSFWQILHHGLKHEQHNAVSCVKGLLFLTHLPTTLLVLLVAVALAVRARSPPEAVLAALVALFILAFDTLVAQHLRASLCVSAHHLRTVLLATEDDDARELRAKAAAAAGGQQAAAAVGLVVGNADAESAASDSTVGGVAIAHVGIELRPTAYGLAVVHWRWLLVGLAAMVQGAGLALGGYALYRIHQY